MFHPKKIPVLLGIAVLSLLPVTPHQMVIGADAAFAGKGGNGNGGGNQGGNGNGHGASSHSQAAEGQSAGAETGGQGRGQGQGASALGNMNGAMHANVQAVLAHIANGNTNGPVGKLAALMAADARASGIDAAAVAAQQAAYQDWQTRIEAALAGSGYADLQEYLDAKAQYEQAQADYQRALQDYEDWIAAGSPGDARAEPTPPAPFQTIAALEEPAPPQPSAEDLAALQAVSDAEAAVLAAWNQNPDADPATLSPAEQDLLASLRARFSDADLAAIAAAAG